MPATRTLPAAAIAVAAALCATAPPASRAEERGETAAAKPGAAEAIPADRTPRRSAIPPVPNGTPRELLTYIEELENPANLPRSRGRQRFHRRKVAAASVTAADGIIAQTSPGDALHTEALVIKLEALRQLSAADEPGIGDRLREFATSLADASDPRLDAVVRSLAVVALVESGGADGATRQAAPLVARIGALLEAEPDNAVLARTATQLVAALERSGDDATAVAAARAFSTILGRADNAAARRQLPALEGTLRRLALVGRAMPIEGRLLDGTAFDQRALAGRVVLVDFWATWCGPCVAEIPNILAAYEKYHDRGFEVVGISLDEDRDVVARFVADRGLPWQVIHDGRGDAATGPSMASRYDVTGIPQLMLIGRDGNVITLNARGRRLEAELTKLFGAAE